MRYIQVMVTKDQYEKIKNLSLMTGFDTLSAFMRARALEQEQQEIEDQQKISEIRAKTSEIHAYLLGDTKKRNFKKNPALHPSS